MLRLEYIIAPYFMYTTYNYIDRHIMYPSYILYIISLLYIYNTYTI